MQAMIFAAGLGTRLRPFTNDRPKALVEIGNTPLLEIAILRLKSQGFTHIVINVHHFADKIEAFLTEKKMFGLNIQISDERNQLLETGGGLQQAIPLLKKDQPVLVINADVLTNMDFRLLWQQHLDSGAIATLAVRHRKSTRYLLFNHQLRLCGWENTKSKEQKLVRKAGFLSQLAFSGIQVVSPELFSYFPDEKPTKFSIIDTYLAAAANENIQAYLHDKDRWMDVGKPANLRRATAQLHKFFEEQG